MSESRLRPSWVLAALLTAAPMHAQDIDSLRASIEQRQLRLEIAQQLQSRADSARFRELARDQERIDTAVVGPFHVVAPVALLPRVAPRFEKAWSEMEPLLGAARNQLRPRTFLVVAGRDVKYLWRDRARVHRQVRFPPAWQAPAVDPAASAVAEALTDALPADLRRWAPSARILQAPVWDAVHRELVLSGSRAARECYEGAIVACRLALGLSDPGPTWEGWYTPEQLRRMALPRSGASARTTLQRQCSEGSREACLAHLRRNGGPRAPLGFSARAALLELALERGGAGAIERLAQDSAASVAQRLERASGRSLDALLRDWHAEVRAARPHARASLGTATASVLVAAVLLLLLAQRSTRWRIG